MGIAILGRDRLRVLAIGAHPDDVELGCFGTLLRLQRSGSEVALCVLSDGERGGSPEHRHEEARASARLLKADLTQAGLPDTEIAEGHPTIGIIEELVARFRPAVVLVPSPDDTHQDHRNAARAALSAARSVPGLLFYQLPSTARTFRPSLFVEITEVIDEKVRAVAIHESQGKNAYMADRTVRGL